jgi:hypothetical protein
VIGIDERYWRRLRSFSVPSKLCRAMSRALQGASSWQRLRAASNGCSRLPDIGGLSFRRLGLSKMQIVDAQVHAYERSHPGRPWVGHLPLERISGLR